jgi:hypothetical protein
MSANEKKDEEREPQERIRSSFYNNNNSLLILNKAIKCKVKIDSYFLFGKCI